MFVYNDGQRWGIPNWETKLFLFKDEEIEELSEDIVSKIPLAGHLPVIAPIKGFAYTSKP